MEEREASDLLKKFIPVFLIFFCGGFPGANADSLNFALVGVEEGTPGYRITESLAAEVGSRSEIDINIIALPAKRAKLYLKQGEIDGDWVRVDGYGKDIPGLIKISEPTASHPYNAYSIRNDIQIAGWKSLKPYSVAYPRGWKVIELSLKPFHKDLVPTDSVDSGLSFVAAGRADVFINIPFIVDSYLRKNAEKFKHLKALEPPLAYLHVYTYLLPQFASQAIRMKAALKAMKADGTYERIMSGSN
jgi:polar amino acid transport system substrate-binding protein